MDIAKATESIKSAMDYLADLHASDDSCRFHSNVEADDIGCLSCLAQTQLADALLILNPKYIAVGMRGMRLRNKENGK